MLKNKRKDLIDYIKEHKNYLSRNNEALDIYEGNLLPYLKAIMQSSLSQDYYTAIEHRPIAINILQRFIDKVSIVYSNPPTREAVEGVDQDFVDFYVNQFKLDNAMMIADCYSNLFKSFAIEPFVNDKGEADIRILAPNTFLVYSDSIVNPEQETIFLKFIGGGESDSEFLIFAYSNEEFDAFYLNGEEAKEFLVENNGVNLYGCIPFVYGKRQKNKLIPTLDSDMISMTKTIPIMLWDMVGASFFQAFSILWAIDVEIEKPKMSPNALWLLRSDRKSDKNPQVGTIKPEADSNNVMQFVMSIFTLWLETKGVRVGSVGSVDGTNAASGIAKMIDEMDAYQVVKKNSFYMEEDEEELFYKLAKIHNYWIKSGQIKYPAKYPSIVTSEEVFVDVHFEKPKPMISKTEELANIKAELELGTMTLEQAVRILHPDYEDDKVKEVLDAKVSDTNNDKDSRIPQQTGEDEVSGISN